MPLPKLKADAAAPDASRDAARGAAQGAARGAPRARLDARKGAAPAYLLEDQVGHLLRRAHQRASAVFLEAMGALDLTPTQYAALVKVADVGEVSQNHLGRLTAMDPATSQGVIRRLEARGLITVRPDPDDRRRSLLSLSPTGRRLLPAAIERGRTITAATLAPLEAEEQTTLLRLLKKLT